ncbi:MAG: ABC transporter permease, partial [Terriglobia bacterium]
MRQLRAWFLRLGGLFSKDRWNRELAEELESHLQMHIEDNLRSGMTAGEARRQALIKLGGMEPTKESYRDRRTIPGLETVMQDIRYGLRMLGKNPGFACAAILTLALGIGANSTVFSWINATLLNPIPGLLHGSQVVAVDRGRAGSMAYPDFLDLRERSHSFSGLTGFALWPMSLTGNGKPQQIWGTLVTANYFDVLGVKPILGRGFLPSEGKTRDGAPVAIISYRLWQTRYGGDPSIVGRTLHVDTHPFTVVGVAPRAFQGSYTGLRTELWAPVMMAPQLMLQLIPGDDYLTTRTDTWLDVLGRLRPGADREQAQAELTTLFQQIARQFPDSHKGVNRISVYPLWRSPNGVNRVLSTLLPMLLGLAGVVLLLACANIANLLLVRGVSRQRELAIRLSLGASRRRLVRQLLMESFILSLAGGGLALLMTLWTAASFADFVPDSDLPVWLSANVDGRVLLATLAISVITALLFGTLPALGASGMNPVSVLKDESGSVAGGRRKAWLSSALAVAQIALSLVLLISA